MLLKSRALFRAKNVWENLNSVIAPFCFTCRIILHKLHCTLLHTPVSDEPDLRSLLILHEKTLRVAYIISVLLPDQVPVVDQRHSFPDLVCQLVTQ